MDVILYIVGMILGAVAGQFTVAVGWVALGLAIVFGYFKRSWFSVQFIGLVGGLIAKFMFSNTAVDEKLGGLPGSIGFNYIVYIIIGCVGYAFGWIVMRVLRKDPDA